MAVEPLRCLTEGLKRSFYLILINLHVDSPMWSVAALYIREPSVRLSLVV